MLLQYFWRIFLGLPQIVMASANKHCLLNSKIKDNNEAELNLILAITHNNIFG